MISKHAITSSSQARHYYAENIERGEYYTGELVPNAWGGNGLAYAGLNPGKEVEADLFEKMLSGHMPNGQQLGRIVVGDDNERFIDHRCGIDFTFAPPKSVSILSEVGGDIHVRSAHELAVEKTMAWLEVNAAEARKGAGGAERIDTENLVYAKFQHTTSREGDPQTHTHVVMINATYDVDENKWRSLSNEKLFNLRSTADAIYKSELAHSLHALGYETAWDRSGSFEIKGISREQIEAFSVRTNQIDKWLEAHGLSRESATHEQKQQANFETRRDKENFDRESLKMAWSETAKGVGIDIQELKSTAETRRSNNETMMHDRGLKAAEIAIDSAIRHLAEREQSFKFEQLLKSGAEFLRGKTTVESLEIAIENKATDGTLISRGNDKFTTKEAIEREFAMERMITEGKGGHREISGSEQVQRALMVYEGKKTHELRESGKIEVNESFMLRAEQKAAATLVANSTDQFVAIQGAAGTGKTSVLEAVKVLAEGSGWEVKGMAAGAKQADILEKTSGIESTTVARFLGTRSEKPEDRNTNEQSPHYNEPGRKNREGSTSEAIEIFRAIAKGPFDSAKTQSVMEIVNGPFSLIRDALPKGYDGNDVIRNVIRGPFDGLQGDSPRAYGKQDPLRELLLGPMDSLLSRSGGGTDLLRAMIKGPFDGVLDKVSNAEKNYPKAHENEVGQLKVEVAKKLWVVDEASQLSQKDFTAILHKAKEEGAKVLFVGDKAQHQAVEAGRAFELAQKFDITTSKLEEMVRQKDSVGKNAVAALMSKSEDAATKAFDTLARYEVKDNAQLIKNLARDYAASPERQETVVVTVTNHDRISINQAIREELKKIGAIAVEGVNSEVFRKSGITGEQAAFADNYNKSDVLVAMRDYRSLGIDKGSHLRVVETNPEKNTVTVEKADGSSLSINVSHYKKFEQFISSNEEFARGDSVRLTKNDRDNGIVNGTTGRIESMDSGMMKIRTSEGDIKVVDIERYKHIEHAYATTTYTAQGETSQKTIYHINTEAGGTNERAFYVGITRATDGTTIYTTDSEKAREQVGMKQDKTIAREANEHERAGMRW